MELDRLIGAMEAKVLIHQQRIIEQKERANALVKNLEFQAVELEEIKKEWVRKKNLEEERLRLEFCEQKKAHRHHIEDLRIKYEQERDNKLRDLKVEIQAEEREIDEWQKRKSEAISKTLVEKAQIDARHQAKLNELLKEEQSASRRGVVRQKRLLGAPNIYSMDLSGNQITGMKKKPYQPRRMV